MWSQSDNGVLEATARNFTSPDGGTPDLRTATGCFGNNKIPIHQGECRPFGRCEIHFENAREIQTGRGYIAGTKVSGCKTAALLVG
jgi:hypothetical protein